MTTRKRDQLCGIVGLALAGVAAASLLVGPPRAGTVAPHGHLLRALSIVDRYQLFELRSTGRMTVHR